MSCHEKTKYIAPTTNQQCDTMQNSSSSSKLSTPDQLLEKYPYAKEIGWTADDIKFLFEEKLVKGELSQQLLILNESFENLLEFHKKQQQSE